MNKQLIIVLAHPRTGSSMLMQTLRLLGVEIIGEFERKDLPQEANPRGYFEDVEILSKGLTEYAIEKIASRTGDALATKIALSQMTKSDSICQWQYLQRIQAKILIPTRNPLEIALSRQVFKCPENKINQFAQVTFFLRKYQLEFKKLAEIFITMVPGLLSNIYLIPYSLAFDDAERYVNKISAILSNDVSEEQKIAARNNIDSSLYRYRFSDFTDEEKAWHRKLGASLVYDALSVQDDPWSAIQAMRLKWQRNPAELSLPGNRS